MKSSRKYFVYILSSERGVLYTGITNDLARRVQEHREETQGFAARYRVRRLVYWEEADDVRAAISREKQIKGWKRIRKLELIRSMNPAFRDLFEDPGGPPGPAAPRIAVTEAPLQASRVGTVAS